MTLSGMRFVALTVPHTPSLFSVVKAAPATGCVSGNLA
jgi:hypothetical protein